MWCGAIICYHTQNATETIHKILPRCLGSILCILPTQYTTPEHTVYVWYTICSRVSYCVDFVHMIFHRSFKSLQYAPLEKNLAFLARLHEVQRAIVVTLIICVPVQIPVALDRRPLPCHIPTLGIDPGQASDLINRLSRPLVYIHSHTYTERQKSCTTFHFHFFSGS